MNDSIKEFYCSKRKFKEDSTITINFHLDEKHNADYIYDEINLIEQGIKKLKLNNDIHILSSTNKNKYYFKKRSTNVPSYIN